jgi:hypothetical protein
MLTARPANLLPPQNWKCNGTVESVKQLVQDLNAGGQAHILLLAAC